MSINAVMKELQQKQRDCTSLQAAVQAATQDLTAALSKRDDCYDRLDCELAAGESIARQSISMFIRCRDLYSKRRIQLLPTFPTDITTSLMHQERDSAPISSTRTARSLMLPTCETGGVLCSRPRSVISVSMDKRSMPRTVH